MKVGLGSGHPPIDQLVLRLGILLPKRFNRKLQKLMSQGESRRGPLTGSMPTILSSKWVGGTNLHMVYEFR